MARRALSSSSLSFTRRKYGLMRAFLLVVLWGATTLLCQASTTPSKPSAVKPPESTTSSKRKLLFVYETQLWDAATQSWQSTIWTNEHGLPSLSPRKLPAPEQTEFVGDWKIVLSPFSSSYSSTGSSSATAGSDGWEYYFRHLKPPKRRRVWLRQVQQEAISDVSSLSTEYTSLSGPFLPQRHHHHPSVHLYKDLFKAAISCWQTIKDDCNFKGFGISLYKSLFSPLACGMALRLPLSPNFDSWDRRPHLPSVTSTISIYYPPTIAWTLSSSLRMEFVQYLLARIVYEVRRILRLVIYQILFRGFLVVVSLGLYPILGRLIDVSSLLSSSAASSSLCPLLLLV